MERNSKRTSNARSLRKKQTKEESLLWYRFLRNYPYRFHRQYVIGNYIADFYCHKAGIVVELDGSQHYLPENHPQELQRTQYLESQELLVLRFSNLDVMNHFSRVCESIDLAVKSRV